MRPDAPTVLMLSQLHKPKPRISFCNRAFPGGALRRIAEQVTVRKDATARHDCQRGEGSYLAVAAVSVSPRAQRWGVRVILRFCQDPVRFIQRIIQE